MMRLRLTVLSVVSLLAGITFFHAVDVRLSVAAQERLWFSDLPFGGSVDATGILPNGNESSTIVVADLGQICLLNLDNGSPSSPVYPWGVTVRTPISLGADYVTTDGVTYNPFMLVAPGDRSRRLLMAYMGLPWRLLGDAGEIQSNDEHGVYVAIGNTTGDGLPEVIMADGDRIKVVDLNTGDLTEAQPFGPNEDLELHVAAGDIDGRGFDEVIVTQANDGGNGLVVLEHVNQTLRIVGSGFPLGENHRHGVTVDVEDLTADGIDEIIAGAARGLTRATIYNVAGPRPTKIGDFIADDSGNGIRVAAGFNRGTPMILTSSGRNVRQFLIRPDGTWQFNPLFAPNPFGTAGSVNLNLRTLTPPRRDITRP